MPTGYTSGVYSGQVTSLREFAKECSKNFPGVAQLLEVGPSNWASQLEEEFHHKSDELDLFLSLSEYDLHARYESEYLLQVKDREVFLIHALLVQTRYKTMLEKVEKWEPPVDHIQLKTFMLSQLQNIMKYDYVDPESYPVPVKVDVQTWYNETKQKLETSVQTAREDWKHARLNVEKTRKWVDDLNNSLSSL